MAIDYLARMGRLARTQWSRPGSLRPRRKYGLLYRLAFSPVGNVPILGLYSAEGLSFIIPELEVAKLEARPELEARRFTWSDQSGYQAAFHQAMAALATDDRKCALDGQTLRFFEWLALQQGGLSPLNTLDIGDLFLEHARPQSAGRNRQHAARHRYQRASPAGDHGMGASRSDRATNR